MTPDSFSDGGDFFDPAAAVDHGLQMWRDGADLVDVGGESTRPGSEGVSAEVETERVIPVIESLAAEGVLVSVDTAKAAVAQAALSSGARVVNDVSALADAEMAKVVAAAGAGVVLMHMQGTPRTMQAQPAYDDVVAEVGDYLVARARLAEDHGIDRQAICLDPGIGFGKTVEHNLALLHHLDALVARGYPVLVGTSRKSFLGALLDGLPPQDREEATGATIALAIAAGVAAVRVHNVVAATRIARVVDAIVRYDVNGGGRWPA